MTTYQYQSKLVSIIEFEREKYHVFSKALGVYLKKGTKTVTTQPHSFRPTL